MCLALPAWAERLRVASFNTELARDGPGLLYRDMSRGGSPDVEAVISLILDARPDVLALQDIDHDLEQRALLALRERLRAEGLDYPHHFALSANAGRATGLDLNGDGRLGGPGDAQGWGRFSGQGAMAVLSRFEIATAEVRTWDDLLWRDLPGALLPETEAGPFPSEEAQAVQRLHSRGAWALPIFLPQGGRFHLLTYHASPPVFDGPEDRNGRRNHDETRFWSLLLGGKIGTAPSGPFVLAGDANLDPERGDGRGAAMKALLANPLLQDPLPGQATVAWPRTGPMRVDYVLPSRHWRVLDAGLLGPAPGGSRHALVWVDLALPQRAQLDPSSPSR